MKGHDRINDLSCVAIQKGNILYCLHPCIGGPFVRGLSEFIELLHVYLARFSNKLVGIDTRKATRVSWLQQSDGCLLVICNHQARMLDFLVVEFLRPDDSLGCIIDEYIQFLYVGEQVVNQVLYLFLGQKIALYNMKSILPLMIVFLGLIPKESVINKPGSGVDCRSVSEQLEADLKTYLDTTTSDQSSQTFQIGSLGPFIEVKGGARRAEITVEVMDFSVLGSTNMAENSNN